MALICVRNVGDSGQIIHGEFLAHLIVAIQFEYTSCKIIIGSSSGRWQISGGEAHGILHLGLKAVIEGKIPVVDMTLLELCSIYEI